MSITQTSGLFQSYFSQGQTTVGTSAVNILAATSITTSPLQVLIKNTHASNILYIGYNSSVTTANGFHVGPGQTVVLDRFNPLSNIWAIASAASTVCSWAVWAS